MEQILLYGHRKPLQDSRKCQMTRTLKGGHYYALLSLSLFFSDHSFICICLSTSPLYFFSHCQAVCLPPSLSLPPFPLFSLPLIHSFIHSYLSLPPPFLLFSFCLSSLSLLYSGLIPDHQSLACMWFIIALALCSCVSQL